MSPFLVLAKVPNITQNWAKLCPVETKKAEPVGASPCSLGFGPSGASRTQAWGGRFFGLNFFLGRCGRRTGSGLLGAWLPGPLRCFFFLPSQLPAGSCLAAGAGASSARWMTTPFSPVPCSLTASAKASARSEMISKRDSVSRIRIEPISRLVTWPRLADQRQQPARFRAMLAANRDREPDAVGKRACRDARPSPDRRRGAGPSDSSSAAGRDCKLLAQKGGGDLFGAMARQQLADELASSSSAGASVREPVGQDALAVARVDLGAVRAPAGPSPRAWPA